MTITIIGTNDGTPEYFAAEKLKTILNSGLENINGKIFIKPNLKVTGTNKQQLDLVVWGEFDGGYETPYSLMVCPKTLENNNEPISNPIPRRVNFKNFFIVIEEKSHSYSGIMTKGNDLEVIYPDGIWKSASKQSDGQVYSVKSGFEDFLKRKRITNINCPFVLNLIWLSQIKIDQVRDLNIPNILPANFDAKLFLQTIATCKPPNKIDKPFLNFISSNSDEFTTNKLLIEFFDYFDKVVYPNSGKNTRSKIENLIQTELNIENQPLFNEVGKRPVIISGKPGSGKTIHLLHIAYHLYKQQNKRCLLLTYNKALSADLERLIYLSRVSSDIYNPAIKVDRVKAFFRKIMIAYGVYEPITDAKGNLIFNNEKIYFLDKYEELLVKLNEMVKANWFDENEKIKIKKDIVKFNWDIILIDEAQDWEDLERDILYKLFGSQNFVIAYGDKQFLRKSGALNWNEINENNNIIKIDTFKNPEIKISYRQASNLVYYQNRLFGKENWSMKSFEKFVGGNVEIYSNPFSKSDLERLLNEVKSAEGAPFDLLMLMPKSFYNEFNQLKTFDEWGFKYQDSVDDMGKLSVDDANGFRCLQYESCRGLEGYTVVCHWFDEYLNSKFNSYTKNLILENMLTDEEAKMRYISNIALIATSRAINKLVITIKDKNSKFGKLIYESKNINPDFISAS